ncbi:MAG: glycosyltransferase family 2 protein [Bacteroidales bacterium]
MSDPAGKYRKIWVALPLMDELENLTLIHDCLLGQKCVDFRLVVCVNQPEAWWQDVSKKGVCERNQETIGSLKALFGDEMILLDRSSPGKGWLHRSQGVGRARKVIMDSIRDLAREEDVIISLDGDTQYGPEYFSSILANLNRFPGAMGISVPYYHRVTGNGLIDRAMLRYEIYMRNYALNLWNIRCPYSFTALGSAIALPVRAYQKIGGMSPRKSGEDFYFLQKMRKAGDLIVWNPERVFPGTRFSDRVFFGTGPALIKGSRGDWSSYPVYHHLLFQNIRATYDLFPELFGGCRTTPMDDFFRDVFGTADIWQALLRNSRESRRFVRACHEKVDALRILQYLKTEQKKLNIPGEQCLRENLTHLFPGGIRDALLEEDLNRLNFKTTSIEILNRIRDFMMEQEWNIQQKSVYTPAHE